MSDINHKLICIENKKSFNMVDDDTDTSIFSIEAPPHWYVPQVILY
jgi:hypothetical protein